MGTINRAPRGGVINLLELATSALFGVGAHYHISLTRAQGQKMDFEALEYWIKKEKWTPDEAIHLMLNIDPRTSKTMGEALSNFASTWGHEEDSEQTTAEKLLRALFSLRLQLETLIDVQTADVEGKDDPLGFQPARYHLNGFKVLNPFRSKSPFELEFPKEAFEPFAKLFVYDGLAIDVPIFGLFHKNEETDLNNWEESLNTPNQTTDNKDQGLENEEIIEGITVGQLKKFLDKTSEEYRPRLEVLIRTIISLVGIPEGTAPYNRILEGRCRELLEEEKIGSKANATAPIEVAKKDIEAIKRISSKRSETTGGRPSGDKIE